MLWIAITVKRPDNRRWGVFLICGTGSKEKCESGGNKKSLLAGKAAEADSCNSTLGLVGSGADLLAEKSDNMTAMDVAHRMNSDVLADTLDGIRRVR